MSAPVATAEPVHAPLVLAPCTHRNWRPSGGGDRKCMDCGAGLGQPASQVIPTGRSHYDEGPGR